MAPHTINTTVAVRQLGKKIICCTPANSSSLITSATNNNARVQMFAAQFPEDSCGWCVLLTTNQLLNTSESERHLLQSLLAGDARDQWLRQQVIKHRLFWWVGVSVKAWSAPSFAGKFLQIAARAPVLFHPWCLYNNSVLSRDFTHQNAQTQLLFNSAIL